MKKYAFLLLIPATTPHVTPSWAYIKLCLTILLTAMGYKVDFK